MFLTRIVKRCKEENYYEGGARYQCVEIVIENMRCKNYEESKIEEERRAEWRLTQTNSRIETQEDLTKM